MWSACAQAQTSRQTPLQRTTKSAATTLVPQKTSAAASFAASAQASALTPASAAQAKTTAHAWAGNTQSAKALATSTRRVAISTDLLPAAIRAAIGQPDIQVVPASAKNAPKNAAKPAVTPHQAPYRCNFDDDAEYDRDWLRNDKDGDLKHWYYVINNKTLNGFVMSQANFTAPTHNFLMTASPVALKAGAAYVALRHKSDGLAEEKLKIYYGTSLDTANINTQNLTLVAEFTDEDEIWKYDVYTFNLSSDGNYYFFFEHCSTPGLAEPWDIYLDDLEINNGTFVGKPDAVLDVVMLPSSSCNLTSTETVGVQVSNVGTAVINEIEIGYSVNDGARVAQTVAANAGEVLIPIGESRVFYFNQKADFSTTGEYVVAADVKVTKQGEGHAAEEVVRNNENTGNVICFTPLEKLPFFATIDTVEELIMDYNQYLGYNPGVWKQTADLIYAHDTFPMVLRCMPLEAEKSYRIGYTYAIGYYTNGMVWKDNFEVLWGKPGTPVSQWTVLKAYNKSCTYNQLKYDEVKFTPSEDGVYSFAILPKKYDTIDYRKTLVIGDVKVEEIPSNDLRLYDYRTTLARKTPAEHTTAPSFRTYVTNRGLVNEHGAKVSVMKGSDLIGVSDTTTIGVKDTVFYNINGQMALPRVGENITLTMKAEMKNTDVTPEDNIKTFSYTVTDSEYAFDADGITYKDGISMERYHFGQVFTVVAADTLTAIKCGWLNLKPYLGDGDPLPAGFEIYALDEFDNPSRCILSQGFDRQLDSGFQIIDLYTPRVLQPGRYFIGLMQLDANNLGIGFDRNPEGEYYVWNGDVLKAYRGDGFLALRAIFGHEAKVLHKEIDLVSMLKPALKGVFTANEKIEVAYRNNGMDPTEVEFKCSVDGTLVNSVKKMVAAYEMDYINFTADLSTPGMHAIMIEAVVEGDDNPENNVIKEEAECWDISPYVMNFEFCDNFMIDDELMPWRGRDEDGQYTYGIGGLTWPNINDPQAFISLPSEELFMVQFLLEQHDSPMIGGSFGAEKGASDDWLVSPKLRLPATGSSVKFRISSVELLEGQPYVESCQVWVSDKTNARQDFKQVGTTYKTTPNKWTQQVVDLSAYNGKEVYVAIRGVSEDQWCLMIDDIEVSNPAGLEPKTDADVSAYVKSYPNPVSGVWTVTAYGLEINRVELYNVLGSLVYRSGSLSTDVYRLNMEDFKSGLYTARVYTSSGVQSVKVSVR